MGHTCIQVIYDEHSSISAILKSLRMMIRRGPQDEPEIFFDVMRAMLFYIDEEIIGPSCLLHRGKSNIRLENPQCARTVL